MKYFGKNLEFIDGTNGESYHLFNCFNIIGWCGGQIMSDNANYLYNRFPQLGHKTLLLHRKTFFQNLLLEE